MSTPTHEDISSQAESEPTPSPDIIICESRPETIVFLESDNSDGWIATDTVVDAER